MQLRLIFLWAFVASGLKVTRKDSSFMELERAPEENRLCLTASIQVKPEFRDELIAVQKANEHGTLSEPGATQFSWGISYDDPNKFVFQEQYLGKEGVEAHKKTKHFETWSNFEKKGGLAAPISVAVFPCKAPPAEKQTVLSYSMADQKARHAKDVSEKNQRVLNIDSIFDGAALNGKRVLVTGTDKGLGLALAKELAKQGAKVVGTCRHSSKELDEALKGPGHQIITKVDVTSDEDVARMAKEVNGPVDILINSAGYFYGPTETLDTMAFKEESKMFEICAVGPLRVTTELKKAGKLLKNGGKVITISSQGGSVAWRTTQNPEGHDYGHHMSKAAANMGTRLLAQELKSEGIAVAMLHPGFARTDMTKKYAKIWDEEGAVATHVAAKRVLHEVNLASMETTGSFINCEDGKNIPF